MRSLKTQIQDKFNSTAATYEQVASIQLRSAKHLISNLIVKYKNAKINKILDLGTGTGYIPLLLIPNYPNSIIDLNDISINMLMTAYNKLGKNFKGNLILGDMEQLQLSKYDLITTNFALQWVEDLEGMLCKLYQSAKLVAFSCLLQGTFNNWLNKFDHFKEQFLAYKYPEYDRLKNLVATLKPKSYWCDMKSYYIRFTSAVHFIRYLKKLGASIGKDMIPFGELKKIISSKESLIINYNVFFGIIQSEP